MTSLFMWYSSHLQGNQLPSILNKPTYFPMHISISEFVMHYVVGYQVVQCCTCQEYIKNTHLITSPYYNPTTYTSCESPRNISFLTASHLTIIRKILQITSQISTGLVLQLVPTKIMPRAMAMFLAWVVQG